MGAPLGAIYSIPYQHYNHGDTSDNASVHAFVIAFVNPVVCTLDDRLCHNYGRNLNCHQNFIDSIIPTVTLFDNVLVLILLMLHRGVLL
eukprot:763203-Amphidinium_carterae.1